jgi:hypothetical protein
LAKIDARAIEAQIVEVLGPEVGRAVARDIIHHALPRHASDEQLGSLNLERKNAERLGTKMKRGRRPARNREWLAIHVAFILRRNGVPLKKTRGGTLDRVLTIAFRGAGESVPADIIDVLCDTVTGVGVRLDLIGTE